MLPASKAGGEERAEGGGAMSTSSSAGSAACERFGFGGLLGGAPLGRRGCEGLGGRERSARAPLLKL